jgi:putative hemolysin
MLKKYLTPAILIILGCISLLTFNLIGSEVGPDGVLHEQFGLIPIGFLLLVSGLLLGLIKSGISVYKNKTRADVVAVGIFSSIIIVGILYICASIVYLTEQSAQELSSTKIVATSTTQSVGSTTSQTQIANPASVNCIKVRGTVQILKRGDGGEYGLCYFEDNRACEEWALLRGECPVGGRKTTGYDTIDQNYCAWNGGETFAVPNSVCTFKNGTKCSTIDFYNGVCQK